MNFRKSHVSVFNISFTASSPQIFVLSGVIAMVTCAVFLRLNSLLKLAVLLLAVAVYSYLIHLAFLTLTRQDMVHRSAAAQAAGTQLTFHYIQCSVHLHKGSGQEQIPVIQLW